jgi:hypothetical protein
MAMPVKRIILFSAGAFAVAIVAHRLVISRVPSVRELDGPRWRTVTILRTKDQIAPSGLLPQPILMLGDLVDVKMSTAPGDRGVELSVRLRNTEPRGLGSLVTRARGTDPRQTVRRALRETKQLLEAGEIVRVAPQPEGRRPATPGGALIDLLARRSAGEGVL